MGSHILLVEDDVKIARGVQQALEGHGYEVAWATTGAEARTSAVGQEPDLVLLDLNLPDMDGVELASELRTRHPDTTIVMLTARTDEIDVAVDLDARRVSVGDKEVVLRPKEFDLLALLASNAGRAIPRDEIMSEVWDAHWFGSTKTLDMHISALRRKLGEDEGRPSRITTLRGIGYRF